MKKLILLLALLVSACSPIAQQVALPTTTATLRPTTCEIGTIKTRDEMGPEFPPDGSFAQFPNYPSANRFDLPDINRVMTLGKTEIDLLISKNKNASGAWIAKNWDWASGMTTGTYYYTIPGVSNLSSVNFNWVVPASGRPFDRNQVCIDVYANGFAHIVGAPHMTDYSAVKDIAWLNYKIYANYRVGTAANGYNSGEFLWNGFLLAPETFPTSKGNNGFWMRQDEIYSRTGIMVQIPWLAAPTSTPQPPTATNFILTNTPDLSTPTFTPPPTFTPVFGASVTPTRTPECHFFGNINNAVCVP